MKKILIFLILTSTHLYSQISDNFTIERNWATYFGGKNFQVRDAVIDSEGYIYMTGMVYSIYIPENTDYLNDFVTPDAHQSVYGGWTSDAYLVKFNPIGELVWSTFYGGTQYDCGIGLTIDNNDDIYLSGWTNSANGIATPSSFLSAFNQTSTYDMTSFVTKFNSDGVRLWGTYFPGNIQDITTDRLNNVYIVGYTLSQTNISTAGTFQQNFQQVMNAFGETMDNGFIQKFTPDGNRVWGSYYGGSNPLSIAVDNVLDIYICGQAEVTQQSTGFYATSGCHQSSQGKGFLSKFNSTGNRVWSTYYGSLLIFEDNIENIEMMRVATGNTKVYVSGYTLETAGIATPGAYKTTKSGIMDGFLVKFDDQGVREWGTYIGGNDEEWTDSFDNLSIKNNQIIVTGNTNSTFGLATTGAYKTAFSGLQDNYFAKFDIDGNNIWTLYYGGPDVELSHGALQASENVFYFWGGTFSNTEIASTHSYQPDLIDGTANLYRVAENSYLAKFTATTLDTDTFDYADLNLYPNPNYGNFTLTATSTTLTGEISMTIYDNLGRKIITAGIDTEKPMIYEEFDFRGRLSSGIYYAKVSSEKNEVKTFKIIVR